MEFWEMTPVEFNLKLRGRQDIRDYDMKKWAWGLANLLNVWTKKGKKIRPSDLYNPNKKKKIVRNPERKEKLNGNKAD